RRAVRSVRAGGGALRGHDRAAGVRGDERVEHPGGDSDLVAAGDDGAAAADPAGVRADGEEVSGEGPGEALADGGGSARRAGVDRERRLSWRVDISVGRFS